MGRLQSRDYYRVVTDEIHEFRKLVVDLGQRLPERGFYSQQCRIGNAALSRSGGLSVVHVHRSHVGVLEEMGAVLVPEGYLEVLIYCLKRRYVQQAGPLDDRAQVYFRRKFFSLLQDLKRGRVGPDGELEVPDVIRRPEELDDTTEDDPPEYVEMVRRRIGIIKTLNDRFENLDRGQCSPLKLTSEPTETELKKYRRKIPGTKLRPMDLGPVSKLDVSTEEEREALLESKPWLKRALQDR
jgi:hypothetical protein